jgi:EmrB/QacA subfamily drug resistance transporter
MDQTILPVALPAIQQEMGGSDVALQWTVNAYLLALAIFTLVGGKLGDRMGYRTAWVCGMAIFALSSALCALSTNIAFLIGARALQGIGGALMFPAQTALVALLFPPSLRGRATGLIVSIGSIFLIIGPLISGYLTEFFSWHWIFWINVPIAAVGIVAALLWLPSSQPGAGKIDLPGFLFFTVGVAAMVIFFMQAPEWGFASQASALCAVIALLFLLLLLRREKRTPHPFLNLTLFKRPLYAAINLSISITQFIMMISVFRTVYIEEILHYTPSQAGLIVSISGLPVLFFSPLGGYLSDKVGPKLPIFLGYACIIASFFWLGVFSTPSLLVLFCASLLFGIGLPLILTPSYSSAMSAVPSNQLGVAFGMVATLRNLAATMGLALIQVFVSLVQQHYLPTEGARGAEITSFSAVHFVLGALMIITFVFFFLLHRRKSAHHLPDSPAEGWD